MGILWVCRNAGALVAHTDRMQAPRKDTIPIQSPRIADRSTPVPYQPDDAPPTIRADLAVPEDKVRDSMKL